MDKRLTEPVLAFASPREWEAWLEEHHATATGLQIRFAKKGAAVESITHAEALELALCYGWIDARVSRFDDTWFLHRFTPRAARSKWSKINRAKALELIEQGRMQPAGLREVERAQVDGRWDAAYDAQSTATVPPDLQAALDANDAARESFATLDSQNRYAILYRLQDAKRPETRARRLEKFVAMLSAGEKLYP